MHKNKNNKKIFIFLLFFSCFREENYQSNLINYFANTQEIQEFCNLTKLCIEEEIQKTFSKDIQQLIYLKKKISIQTCSHNQSRNLISKLFLDKNQKKEFWNSLQKKDIIYSHLENIHSMLNSDQNKIINTFIYCKNKISIQNSCESIKNIIKNDLACKKIFENYEANN